MRHAGSPILAALAVAALSALAAACAGQQATQRPPATAAARHPEVDADLESCASCHAQVTPQVAAQWKASRHGLDLVKCFVCHGSTGSDFRARPEPTGCAGCHPVQVASVTRAGVTARCFDCHPPHALTAQGPSPHGGPPPRT